jgi:hypothetical protein
MLKKKNMDSGDQQIKMVTDLSRLSLKTSVSQPPVTILKGGRKVSLLPELMKVR